MFWSRYMGYMGGWGFPSFLLGWLLPLILLDLVLKGFALWKSARLGQKWWFIALLLINSVGILPAIYLLIYSSKKSKKK